MYACKKFQLPYMHKINNCNTYLLIHRLLYGNLLTFSKGLKTNFESEKTLKRFFEMYLYLSSLSLGVSLFGIFLIENETGTNRPNNNN